MMHVSIFVQIYIPGGAATPSFLLKKGTMIDATALSLSLGETNDVLLLRFRKLIAPNYESPARNVLSEEARPDFLDKFDAFVEEHLLSNLPDESVPCGELLDFMAAQAHGLVRRDPLFYDELAKLALYVHVRTEVDEGIVPSAVDYVTEYVFRMNNHLHPFDSTKRVPLIRDDITFDLVESSLSSRIMKCLKDHGFAMVRRMTYAGMTVLVEKYLKRDRTTTKLIETPELMMVRVALECWRHDADECVLLLEYLLTGRISMASPVYFNAGTIKPQMASCFLLEESDSMDGIYESLKRVAMLSKEAGGIGMCISPLRGKGAYIVGSDGFGKGSTAILKTFEDTMMYADQGGGKRKGAGATFKDISHIDIWDFLKSALPGQCDKIFYGCFASDLFFRRVEEGGDWTMFCPMVIPDETKRLYRLHGDAFDREYVRLENDPVAMKRAKVIPAKVLLEQIVDVAMETRSIYVCAKDIINACNMQQNVGPVITSNLCVEIYEVTQPDHVAVCNLASINVSAFITDWGEIDHTALRSACEVVTRTANRIIDITHYPVEEARVCNLKMRPVGVGIQGLADAVQAAGKTYDSPEGVAFCAEFAEAIQYNCLRQSYHCAQKAKGPYPKFEGSPYSKGIFHHELWAKYMKIDSKTLESGKCDWNRLRDGILDHGLRNSNVVAYMPTASSSIITGVNEAFYGAYPANIYNRQTNAGDRAIINRGMFHRLKLIGAYTPKVLAKIFRDRGSIAHIDEIPEEVRTLYPTLHELSGLSMIRALSAMQPFVCQGISMSPHIHYDQALDAEQRLEQGKMYYKSFIIEAKKAGLKTLGYYARSNAFTEPNDYGTVRAAMSQDGEKETPLLEVEGNRACTDGACEA